MRRFCGWRHGLPRFPPGAPWGCHGFCQRENKQINIKSLHRTTSAKTRATVRQLADQRHIPPNVGRRLEISHAYQSLTMKKLRQDFEPPEAIIEWGWKFHHIGIPTPEKMPDETYLPQFKFYVSGFPSSPFGIEWMRFEKSSPINSLIQKVPHIAFEVENLDLELRIHQFKILSHSNSPSDGVRVAMIEHNGAPIELIEFVKE